MVKSLPYRAVVGVAWPKSDAAAARIKAGKARADDWTEICAGELCDVPAKYQSRLLASGDIECAEEVRGDG